MTKPAKILGYYDYKNMLLRADPNMDNFKSYEVVGIANTAKKMIKEYEAKRQKVLLELSNFCKECPSNTSCPEEECVIYRIEKIIEKE